LKKWSHPGWFLICLTIARRQVQRGEKFQTVVNLGAHGRACLRGLRAALQIILRPARRHCLWLCPNWRASFFSTLTTMQPVKKKGGGHDERGADQDFVFHFLVFVFVPTAVKIGAHSRT
jgi:hypothetical protein